MKKLIPIVFGVAFLCGCGNDWEITKKNLKSDFGDLTRHVVVYDSWSGKVLWEYTGDVYLREAGKGNYSIVYRDDYGKVRKNDYVGNHLSISLEEVVPKRVYLDGTQRNSQ